MEVTLKQRLIGAVVLIALAVIFVPMILDGSGWKKSVVSNIKVQPEPKFTFESELPDPKRLNELPALERDNGSDAKQTMADKKSDSETQSAVEQTPTPEVQSTPSFFSVTAKLSSFRENS